MFSTTHLLTSPRDCYTSEVIFFKKSYKANSEHKLLIKMCTILCILFHHTYGVNLKFQRSFTITTSDINVLLSINACFSIEFCAFIITVKILSKNLLNLLVLARL